MIKSNQAEHVLKNNSKLGSQIKTALSSCPGQVDSPPRSKINQLNELNSLSKWLLMGDMPENIHTHITVSISES